MTKWLSGIKRLAERSVLVVALLLTSGAAISTRAAGQSKPAADKNKPPVMRQVKTPYYTIYTDIDDDELVREAAVRMTAMGQEYARRISGFGARVHWRLPFYLFSRMEDYLRAGGPKGTWGVYLGTRLMAVAAKGQQSRTWFLIQHEGFHQYLGAAMPRKIPVWLKEGLAEYFGHGIWTGDGFVMGAVPRYRLLRVKIQIKVGKVMALADLLKMNDEAWKEQMTNLNYDQAWSLIHFLIHGQDGRYRKAFGDFLTDVGRGRPWEAAFVRQFGGDTKALQERHDRWWLSQEMNPTPQVYATAVVQTLTSFLGRAVAKGQRIKDFEDFRAKAAAGELACREDQWLPPKLLAQAMRVSRKYRNWRIVRTGAYPSIVLTDRDGGVYTGTFIVRRGRAARIAVAVKPAPKTRKKGK